MHPSFREILARSGPQRLAKMTSEKAPVSRPEAALADPYTPAILPQLPAPAAATAGERRPRADHDQRKLRPGRPRHRTDSRKTRSPDKVRCRSGAAPSSSSRPVPVRGVQAVHDGSLSFRPPGDRDDVGLRRRSRRRWGLTALNARVIEVAGRPVALVDVDNTTGALRSVVGVRVGRSEGVPRDPRLGRLGDGAEPARSEPCPATDGRGARAARPPAGGRRPGVDAGRRVRRRHGRGGSRSAMNEPCTNRGLEPVRQGLGRGRGWTGSHGGRLDERGIGGRAAGCRARPSARTSAPCSCSSSPISGSFSAPPWSRTSACPALPASCRRPTLASTCCRARASGRRSWPNGPIRGARTAAARRAPGRAGGGSDPGRGPSAGRPARGPPPAVSRLDAGHPPRAPPSVPA